MPSPKPLELGKFYHLYNRGNNRENIFIEERNYRYFLEQYAKYIHPIADTYAYCLLRNHFHVLVRIKLVDEVAMIRSQGSERSEAFRSPASLSPFATRGFQSLFKAYAMAINKGYGRSGKLFQEHFGRIEVDSDNYFTNLIFYIHFNPQKHGFVKDFREWPWSSYSAMHSSNATKLKRGEVLDWFDGATGFEHFHQGAVDEKMITKLTADDFD